MARGVVLTLATVSLLALAGSASAASPQKIYRDLADNGRLDQHYSKRDINRALHMPSLRRYDVDAARSRPLPAPVTPAKPAAPEKARAIPFTGIDLALFGGVGGPLLILGAGLGRLMRLREQELQP